MKDRGLSFKIAAVFIGTIVGAGLASGQEIIQFFTIYGFKGMLGIALCGIFYVITGVMTLDMSYKYKAASYKELIYSSCGKHLGRVIDTLTTFFIFGGISIILAGSGAIFFESFGIPRLAGTLIMAVLTAIVVFYSTDGLIFINSIIVPCMIIILIIISFISITNYPFPAYMVRHDLFNAPVLKKSWLLSSILYSSFNMLFATGVLAPMTRDIKKTRSMYYGLVMGSIGLLLLALMINMVLLLNQPGIYKFSVPMLFVARNIGSTAGNALSIIIWLEMFSTEVANVYSLSKKMHSSVKIDYRISVVLLLLCAIPFTTIGFENLIKLLYPAFGIISLVYIICLTTLYWKSKSNKVS